MLKIVVCFAFAVFLAELTHQQAAENGPDPVDEGAQLDKGPEVPDSLGSETPNELCNLKPETGQCKAMFRRYHFNSTTEQCEMFVYGGCGGNANNFEDIADCQKACLPLQ